MKPNLKDESGAKLVGTVQTVLNEKGRRVHSIAPDASVYDAIVQMNEHEVGALFVMEDSRLVGVLSERDCTRKVMRQERAPKTTRVHEVMTTPVIYVDASTPLPECMHVINHHRVRHLPVMEADRIVGVVSIGDIVRRIVDQQAETIDNLNAMITDTYPG